VDGILAYNAGMYVAGMMAQMNLLRQRGHSTSEVVNESLIEAIDSLNVFMDKSGVGRMVDGCSITARLGTRKWGPEFRKVFSSEPQKGDARGNFELFLNSPLHGDIAKCFEFRPKTKLFLDN
jgi:ketol-acid reductoisomerase